MSRPSQRIIVAATLLLAITIALLFAALGADGWAANLAAAGLLAAAVIVAGRAGRGG